MGTRLVVKGSNFESYAVSKAKSYEKVKIGTAENLWSRATSNASSSFYGFEVPNDGYISGIRAYLNSNANNFTIAVYSGVGGTKIKELNIQGSFNIGTFDYEFGSALEVSAGNLIEISGLHFQYRLDGGDIPTYSGINADTPTGTNYRIYTFNFYLQKELIV